MSFPGLKSIFISAYISVLSVGLLLALIVLWHHPERWAAWGVALASGAPLAFFMRLFLSPVARTSASLTVLPTLGAAGTVLAWWFDGMGWAALVAALNGVVLTSLYIHWYSRFSPREPGALTTGHTMPLITLETEDGRPVSTPALTQTAALWLFYRGNWCPLCMAQIREVAQQYRDLQTRGVAVYLISPQPAGHTRDLAAQFEAPMHFLRDPQNHAAAQLGILAKDGLPAGLQVMGYDNDVPMPTVFITAPGGRIVYSDLTENYRIRPEPSEFIKALDQAGL